MKQSTSILLCITILFSGCGTLVHGTSQNVLIQSEPSGAKARLSNGLEVTTPDSVVLERGENYIVTFEKDGYQKKQVQITKHFNAKVSILGNILWLLVGVVVDLVAGGAWTLKPEAVHTTLEKA